MPTYYRFQHGQPKPGEVVHCFRDIEAFRGFVRMMRRDDPEARRMGLWEIDGRFVRDDDGDALVRVVSAKPMTI